MASYLLLSTLTAKGAETIKELPARAQRARAWLGSVGVEIKESYLAMGRYDIVLLVEAPNDETMAKAALGLAATGNITTETLRLFGREQIQEMIAALP